MKCLTAISWSIADPAPITEAEERTPPNTLREKTMSKTTTTSETLKHGRLGLTTLSALLVAALFALAPVPALAESTCGDMDGDGVCNADDNCLKTANPMQYNSDDDALGDACDCDYNQDRMVDELDFELFADNFGDTVLADGSNGVFDHNEDGEINVTDYISFQRAFGSRVKMDGR